MTTARDLAETRSPAELAGVLFALDPLGFGGVCLRGMPGPERDAWLKRVHGLMPAATPWRKVPVSVGDERLLGGLDYTGTLRARTPRFSSGLLETTDGGVLVCAMAERMRPGTAATIATVVDTGSLVLARDGFERRVSARCAVVALDEGIEPDEAVDDALSDRLAFHVTLANGAMADVAFHGVSRSFLDAVRKNAGAVTLPDPLARSLAGTSLALGIQSLRADLFAVRAARWLAALAARREVSDDDAALAAQLVLAPRARYRPEVPVADETDDSSAAAGDDDAQPDDDRETTPDSALDDVVLEATVAALPKDLLSMPAQRRSRSRGAAGRSRAGQLRRRRRGGRPVGTVAAERVPDGRINLLATLKAALPWQTIRRTGATSDRRLLVRKSDLQVTRYKDRNEATTLFVVDASGSQAAQRLGEVKGAIELLLAECYVRRDRVAMVTFRGRSAEVTLGPTRALALARRKLAALPGGGGTPLAAGIDEARELVASVRRQGQTPTVVFLTDGRANVTRDGAGEPVRATEDALNAARLYRQTGPRPIVVDTARRPRPAAEQLAAALDGKYLPMPYANAASLNAAVARFQAS